MPITTLPIQKPYQNGDSTSLTSQLDLVQDGYLNELGHFISRPGFELFCDLGTGKKVDGLHWSDSQENVATVSNGNTYKITDKFGTKTDLSSSTLIPGRRVRFCEGYNGSTIYLFMVNGGGIHFTDFTTTTQLMSGASTPAKTGTLTLPTAITEIVNYHGYIVINEVDSNSWYFPNPNSPFAWDTGDTYDTEKSSDPVTSISIVNDRLLLGGKSTIEPWYNVGTPGNPLLRNLNATFVNSGIISPYTIDVVDESIMYYINKDRRVVRLSGSSHEVISKAYDKEIQGFSSVADANAFVMNEGGKSFYVVNFPQDNRSLVYDIELDIWYEWGYWNETKSQYDIFKANCYCYARKWNLHLIGDTNGKIYKVSSDYVTDNGDTIRSMIRTGNGNYGDDATLKVSSSSKMRLKRGVGKDGDTGSAPYILVRKRDNGKQTYGNFKKISLGALGDTQFSRTLYKRGGRFYSRQYEIVMPDDAPIVIAGLWENITTGVKGS